MQAILKLTDQNNRRIFGRLLLIFTILLIIAKVIFYFYIIDIVHAPDYGHHHYVLNIYKDFPSSVFLFAKEKLDIVCSSFSASRTGLTITSPNLYGLITGKVFFLLDLFLKNGDLSLKLTNLLQTSFGLLNIFFVYKISGFIFKNKIPRIFVILLLANIQMFSYLMNFLSYDNLTNLASTASIYYLLKYFKDRNIRDIFILTMFVCIGVLAKYTSAVLFVLLGLVFLYCERKNVKEVFKQTFSFVRNKKNILYVIGASVLVFATSFFYAKNYLTFGTLLPSGSVGNQYCLDIIEGEKENEDVILEKPAEHTEVEKVEKISFISFTRNWFDLMIDRTINIASHKSLYKPPVFKDMFAMLFLFSACLLILNKNKDRNIKILCFLFLGYLVYLLFYKYYYYITSELVNEHSAVAGRYFFPVIGPFIILFVYSFWNTFKNKIISIIILSIISLFFVYSDTIYLFQNYKVWSVAYTNETKDTVGPISSGQSSLKQKFKIGQEYSNSEIGIYAATYTKGIKGGYVLNLYEGDCLTNIETVEIKRIMDNNYTVVEFEDSLEYERMYCFDIENTGNELPITLWYSLNDIEGSVIEVLLEDKEQINGLVGVMYEGESSPKQKFYVDEGYSNDELAVFASTYAKNIEEGYIFNLYDEDCMNRIDSIEIKNVWDNDYFFVNFEYDLEYNKNYCFDVENLSSKFPITLWYSKIDLNGGILNQENIDLHYSQIKRYEDYEKDILYSPIREYGF